MITQSELKELLSYNIETGEFKWLVSSAVKIKIGRIAGSLCKYGYVHIKIRNKLYLAHRLAWLYVYGYWPEEIDHIDGVKSNNKITNLRECTNAQNRFNMPPQKNNKSGYRGVRWSDKWNKWVAQAKLNGKVNHLGHFDDIKEAAKAYQEFAKKHHGDFIHASLN